MSYIIAATDLSAIADNAVYYAAGLAEKLRSDLVILHAFSMPVMIGDVPAPASLINDTQADAEHKMRELEKAVAEKHTALGISSLVIFVNVIESMEHYAETHRRPQFAVMGNRNSLENSAWFFSTLKTAANDLSFPVLAIPPGLTFTAPGSVCLALDVEREHPAHTLDTFSAMCAQLHLTLHVLNVQKDVLNRDNLPEVPATVQKALAPASPHYHFRYEGDIDQTIDHFCMENNIDWLVVIHGKYSLFEGIFHRSHTKALAATAHLPMLILHERKP